MLPTRAYADVLPPFSDGARAEPQSTDARPALITAVAQAELDHFPVAPFVPFAARDTAEALRLIERWRPRIVAIDWDLPELDAARVCDAARQVPGTGLLVFLSTPEPAPAALKAGCHAILLKPLTVNLIAARLGRLSRELPSPGAALRLADRLGHYGTNRTWADVACPTCERPGAVAFEYASHRRSWYACLACDAVWLGRRRE